MNWNSIKRAFVRKAHVIFPEFFLLRMVYVDGEKRKWYGFNEPAKAPIERYLKVQEATKYADMGMNRDFLLKAVERMNAALNPQEKGKINFTDVFLTVREMETRLNLNAERESTIELIAALYLLEGEDMERFDEEIHLKKKAYLRANGEALRFFSKLLAVSYYHLTEKLASDFHNFLSEADQLIVPMRDLQPSPTSTLSIPSMKKRA